MKKFTIALLMLASAVSLAGCSDGGSSAHTAASPVADADVKESSTYFYGPKSLASHKVTGGPDTLIRILNEDDSLTTCAADGSGDLFDCEIQELDAEIVRQMVVNPRSGSVYFLQDNTYSVLVCDGAKGALSSCVRATGGDNFRDPSSLVLNASGTVAYATNEDNTLTVCQVLGDGNFSGCAVTDMNGALDTPVKVGLASGEYGTHAYFLNGETKSVITACTLAPNGVPSACRAQNNELFTAPTTIAFSSNGRYAYIGNLDDNVVICRIENDATFSACHAVYAGEQELFAGILKIAADSSNANIYVANGRSGRITHCKLTGGGADFADCVPYRAEGFEITTDVALYEVAGSAALFLTSVSNDSVYGCPLQPNGGFGQSCIRTRFME